MATTYRCLACNKTFEGRDPIPLKQSGQVLFAPCPEAARLAVEARSQAHYNTYENFLDTQEKVDMAHAAHPVTLGLVATGASPPLPSAPKLQGAWGAGKLKVTQETPEQKLQREQKAVQDAALARHRETEERLNDEARKLIRRKAFDPLSGQYSGRTRHSRDARRIVERALGLVGEDLAWDRLTFGKMMSLARLRAEVAEDGKGLRAMELMCSVLYGMANWLRREGLISATACLAPPGWRRKVREEWVRITGVPPEEKEEEDDPSRYTEEEAAKILAALPKGDPRLRLLMELASELRAGQAVRARRTDLKLAMVGGFGLGRFVVHGRGKKLGGTVDLHHELRVLVDEVLDDGYLSDAEVAYQRGEIKNYYLFPAGRFRRGKATVKRCVAGHLDRRTLREMFVEVEAIAQVEHQPGRAFYGLRR